jgi:hypothetical protein
VREGEQRVKKRLEIYNEEEIYPNQDESSESAKLESKKRKKIPAKAVAILKEWLVENVQDPYPSNDVKEELAKKTNLDVKQVTIFFFVVTYKGSELVY